MVGSNADIAFPLTVFASCLSQVLRELREKVEGSEDKKQTLCENLRQIYKAHERIIYNGDCYSEDFFTFAKSGGLSFYEDTLSALGALEEQRNRNVFLKSGVFDERELEIVKNVILEKYVDDISLEARASQRMLKSEILPKLFKFYKSDMMLDKFKTEFNLYRTSLYKASQSLEELLNDMDFFKGKELFKSLREIKQVLFEAKVAFFNISSFLPKNYLSFCDFC